MKRREYLIGAALAAIVGAFAIYAALLLSGMSAHGLSGDEYRAALRRADIFFNVTIGLAVGSVLAFLGAFAVAPTRATLAKWLAAGGALVAALLAALAVQGLPT